MTRKPDDSDPELIVLGGGCAGLSLAARLLDQRPSMPIVVIEPRTEYCEDRTWCGWRLNDHFFQDCAIAEWNDWRILGKGRSPLLRHSSYPYEMISASRFYAKACRVIERSSNATLLMGAQAGRVSEAADHVLVHLADGTILRSRYVIDTRPEPRVLKYPWLWQNFVGYVVASGDAAFGLDDTPTLMDFQDAGPDIARFMYVLPCGSNTFLCEFTNFSKKQDETALLEQELVAWLDEHAVSGWRLLRRESGSLPMAPPPEATQGRVFPAGTRGGSMRISTGYAFHRIQRWADECASSILATGTPLAPRRNPVLDGMDELFLSVLQQSSVSAGDLFGQLFHRCPTDPLVRFLSGVPRPRDLWSVARSLPWGRFLRAGPSLASAYATRMRESR